MGSGRRALVLDEVRSCGNVIQRAKVATLLWPHQVHNRTDWLCRPDANEEKTLATSSPVILTNPSRRSHSLLLTVKNRVYTYDVTLAFKNADAQLKTACKICKGSGSCDARDTAGIVLDSKGTVAALEGRSAEDHNDSSSRMQMTIHGETLFVMNSFNLIQSLDMSMHIPCGRVMSVFTPIFKKKKW